MADAVAAPGTEEELGFELPLGAGRVLPPGHYRITVPVLRGGENLRAPILEILSALRARDRSVRLERLARKSGYSLGCDVALISAANALRFVPGSVDGDIQCGPVQIRRLTRLEYYSRLVARVLSRQKREGASLRALLGKMVDIARTRGIRSLAADLRRTDHLSPDAAYELWIEIRERLDHGKEVFRQRLKRATGGLPKISLIMVVGDVRHDFLAEAVASVRDQVYEDWELIVAVFADAPVDLVNLLNDLAGSDARIRLLSVDAGLDPASARNAALRLATGDRVAALAAEDTLSPIAFATVAFDAALHPDTQLHYGDDDILGPNRARCRPRFKPEFSRELLRSTDYLGALLFHRTALLRELDGWSPGFGEAVDYDLALRTLERTGAGAIRHIAHVLHHRRARPSGASKPRAMRRALENHFERIGMRASVELIPGIDALRTRHSLPSPAPMVSLVVPTRDKVELLRGCVESILALTEYDNYEIIVVDNDSTEPSTADYLAELRHRDRVRVISFDGPFNFSRINNFAVGQANGAVIGLLNNDTVVISPDWLTEMVSWAAQADIGCVGAKLYYADDTIQHAGVVIGVGDVAGHAHRSFLREDEGYCQRLKVVQNVSAVTAACLVVRKEIYEKVGGLNDRDLTVAYNDVDFCLRVRAAGYVNVWTPFAELYHLESLSRGSDRSRENARRYADEVAYMHLRWDLRSDPYYSPHLTRLREDFSIAV
ncbi:MAG TPA: glycosyltransferase [Rhizobiales bacterium]|nr:glycosyltransferase [Hyphomicrobiales bacterium]